MNREKKVNAEISIIGSGETIENCFTDVAANLFSLLFEVPQTHLTQIITFEFEEEDVVSSFKIWLDLLLKKAKEHHLMFGDFRLKREHNSWKATISGEPWRVSLEHGIDIKKIALNKLSVDKVDFRWEAHCFVKP